MTETGAVSIEDVRTLVAERQRYDDWLSALDARRADTPARVFDRVHADYMGRRAGIMEQLREHVSTLAALGDELESRLTSLELTLSSHEDERAEAMLRTAVGEYDAARWDEVKQHVEANISTLAVERTAVLAEVDDVRALLASARVEPPMSKSTERAPEHIDVVDIADDHAPDVFSDASVSLDLTEQADRAVDAVAAETVAVETVAVESIAIETQSVEEPDNSEFDDALALFSPSADPGLVELEPRDTFRVDAAAAQVATATPASQQGGIVEQRESFDELAFLRSVIDPSAKTGSARTTTGSDQAKSLRCTECGTMNFPTEWYCERCGGELAAF